MPVEALRPFRPGERRPNADGSYSTEITTTWQMPDGSWANVPSLWMGLDGKPVQFDPNDEDDILGAARAYEAQGYQFPRYKTLDEAERAATARSRAGGVDNGNLATPVSTPSTRKVTLDINGREVEVDDGFLSLSPEKQNATVDEIAHSLGIKGGEPATNQPPGNGDDRNSILGKVDSAVRGAADMATLGFADEIAAGLGTGFGLAGDYDKELARQRGIDKSDEENRPGYRLGGQVAGALAGGTGLVKAGLSPTARAIDAGFRLPGVAAASGLEGLTLGGIQGFGSGEGLDDRLAQAETGAKLGVGAGAVAPYLSAAGSKIVQKVISPFATSPERTAAANVLQREGVDLTAGQKTGSKGLRYAESEIGGGKASDILDNQNRQFTAAALRKAGIDADSASPEVIDGAFNQIGQRFDDLAARNTLLPDRKLANDMITTYNDYQRMVPESMRVPAVKDIANDVLKAMTGGKPIPGDVYQSLRSRLETMARKTSNNDAREAFRGLKDSLDDAMERSIAKTNPADAGAWRDVRNQYRNMLVLEKAATGAGENAALGMISPSQLRNATVQQGRRAYARGKGDFADLARAGEAILKPLPQSGTAPRLAARNLGALAPSIVGASAGAGYGAQDGGGLEGALTGALAGFIAPKAIGRLMMSKTGQRYLANQLLLSGQMTPEKRALVNAVLNYGGSAAAGRLGAP